MLDDTSTREAALRIRVRELEQKSDALVAILAKRNEPFADACAAYEKEIGRLNSQNTRLREQLDSRPARLTQT